MISYRIVAISCQKGVLFIETPNTSCYFEVRHKRDYNLDDLTAQRYVNVVAKINMFSL